MAERSYEGRLVDDKDGFEAIRSDTFHMTKLIMGRRGDEYTVDQGELEAFAKWVLNVQPYGTRSIA